MPVMKLHPLMWSVHQGEDSAYLSQAESVIDSILSAQSTDVDTVSGATFSSTGILNAVDDALGKAENS